MVATTPDWANIDHRSGVQFAPGEMDSFIRSAWDLTPNVKYHIRSVHHLADHGAVVAAAGHGTSPEGFDAEWV